MATTFPQIFTEIHQELRNKRYDIERSTRKSCPVTKTHDRQATLNVLNFDKNIIPETNHKNRKKIEKLSKISIKPAHSPTNDPINQVGCFKNWSTMTKLYIQT